MGLASERFKPINRQEEMMVELIYQAELVNEHLKTIELELKRGNKLPEIAIPKLSIPMTKQEPCKSVK